MSGSFFACYRFPPSTPPSCTQMMNQQYQEPWLAVVVDPMRTMAAGKVEIGAFR